MFRNVKHQGTWTAEVYWLCCELDCESGFKTRQWQDTFLIFTATRLSVGCIQCLMQWALLLITHLCAMPKLRLSGAVWLPTYASVWHSIWWSTLTIVFSDPHHVRVGGGRMYRTDVRKWPNEDIAFWDVICIWTVSHLRQKYIYSFIQYSVWREVQSLLQNDSST